MHPSSPGLVQASLDGNFEEVRRFVESGADVNSVDKYGRGPLLTFAPSVMQYLLSQGADPNRQKNETGSPVLVGIAYVLNLECVRLLLEAGADPNVPSEPAGETPLHACLCKPAGDICEADRFEIVKLLLEAGADPNQRTIPGVETLGFWRDVRTRGETPLHRAAAYASDETIRLLLKAGADKTLRDANNDSPQTWASWHWRPKALIDLLAAR